MTTAQLNAECFNALQPKNVNEFMVIIKSAVHINILTIGKVIASCNDEEIIMMIFLWTYTILLLKRSGTELGSVHKKRESSFIRWEERKVVDKKWRQWRFETTSISSTSNNNQAPWLMISHWLCRVQYKALHGSPIFI